MRDKSKEITLLILKSISIYIFILLTFLCLYFCIDKEFLFTNSSNTKMEEFIPKETEHYYSYNKLLELNEEVVGWIKIDNTKINYPLVQANDNNKYLHTNSLGEYASSGSLFLDASNNSDFSDFSTIIYGHHMSNGDMFGDLDKFNSPDFFNENKYASLFICRNKYKLNIFAYINKADGYDYNLYNTNVTNYEDYLKYIRKVAKYYRDVDINSSSHIVLLSTCNGLITNGRTILAGKIEEENSNNRTLELDKRKILIPKGLIIITIFLVVVLFVLLIIIKRIRRT